MSSEPLTCPYCNALLPVGDRPASGKQICPRCGEAFAGRSGAPDDVGQASSANDLPLEPSPVLPTQRWSNRSVAAVTLGVMASMGIVALTWALLSVEERRLRDDIMAKLNDQGKIESASVSIERILGVGPADCVGKPLLDFVQPDDRPGVDKAFRQALAQPADLVPVECRFLNPDGSPRGVKLKIQAEVKGSEVKGVLVNLQEITDVPLTNPDRAQAGTPAPRRLPLLVLVVIGILVYALAGALVVLATWIYRLGKRLKSDPAPRPGTYALIGCLAAACLADLWVMHVTMSALSRRPAPPQAIVPAAAPARPVPPAELEALGYLPPRTNVIAAVHVAEALQTPPGKEFLDRFQLGRWGLTPAELEKWTSFKPDDIDHIVVGATLDTSGFQLVIVAKTRQPYDEAKVRATIKTTTSTRQEDKKFYHFSPRALPFDAVVWFPPRKDFLVIALGPESLKEVPEQPRTGKDQVPAQVRAVVADHLGKIAQFWLAINLEDPLTINLLGPRIPEKYRDIIDKLRLLGLAIRLDVGLEINAALQYADDKAAQQLAAKWLAGAPDKLEALLKFFGPLQGFQPLLQEMAQSIQHQQKDCWLIIKTGARLETLQKALQQKPSQP